MIVDYSGDNCIHNFHLGRYIVRNLVLRRCASEAVKRDFRTYVRRYTSPNKKLVIPILMHFCSLKCCKSHKAARHPTKCDVIDDVKVFPTVYCRHPLYCHKFLTLSNQTSRYKSKCIRIFWLPPTLCDNVFFKKPADENPHCC